MNLTDNDKEILIEVGLDEHVTPNEAFSALLNYAGFSGYDYWIKHLIERCYGVHLD